MSQIVRRSTSERGNHQQQEIDYETQSDQDECLWAAMLQDRVGGLAGKLAPLAAAGANLEFIIARRAPEQPGRGVVFVTPLNRPPYLIVG
jgi:hypothetical protein